MVEYSRMQEVKAPRERVFRYLTDVERFPELFPEIFKKMSVVRTEDDSRIIECEEIWAGRHFRYFLREKQFPPTKIQQVVTEGSGKGTTETLTLEETPEGTRVVMTIDAKSLAATVLGRLFRKQFEKEMDQIFGAYMKVVEASN